MWSCEQNDTQNGLVLCGRLFNNVRYCGESSFTNQSSKIHSATPNQALPDIKKICTIHIWTVCTETCCCCLTHPTQHICVTNKSNMYNVRASL